jgi:hypothetical protein
MISEKEFDRDAALLAGIVGGHLNYVDSITSDRSQPANRIDINSFIAPLRGGPPPVPNKYDPANKGYISEQMVQNMAPDVAINLIENIQVPTGPINGPSGGPGTYAPPSVTRNQVSLPTDERTTELLEDIKSIKATLQKIDSTFTKITGMMGKVFNFITEKEKLNK